MCGHCLCCAGCGGARCCVFSQPFLSFFFGFGVWFHGPGDVVSWTTVGLGGRVVVGKSCVSVGPWRCCCGLWLRVRCGWRGCREVIFYR